MNAELAASVRIRIAEILVHGATPVASVESFLHGDERRCVREVIRAHPERFEVFERGFPTVGPKTLWVRLRRTGRSEERTSSAPFPK